MDLWPHQIRAIDSTLAAIARGERRICLTTPTGGGKTRVMECLVRSYINRDLAAILYTNRTLLRDQLSDTMLKAGLGHGVRAAGHYHDLDQRFQISSIQTERSRVLKKKTWEPFPADIALVDEAHLQASPTSKAILEEHIRRGGVYVGLTATPMNLKDLYDSLIVAGTNSELRACGALVPATHFGCDEPDLSKIKGKVGPGDDPSEDQVRSVMGRVKEGEADERIKCLFGRVIEWFAKLNPERKATILFAPGRPESIWFAEQFEAAGIPAAHIDGENVWVAGRLHRSTRERRAEILEMSKTGKIVVLCNRFVLREGIDAPWLAHGIFATVFGSVQTYIQSGGRLLRFCPGKEQATIQDHGGHWWRPGLGSLNADREWRLDYTSSVIAGLQEDRMRSGAEPQPVRCPRCSMVRIWRGPRCPTCGYELPRSAVSRPVVQLDGALKEMRGDVFRPRRTYQQPDAAKLWERLYYRAKSEKWDATFRQAEAMFCQENRGRYPPRGLPLMPRDPNDFFRKVRDVPPERLVPR